MASILSGYEYDIFISYRHNDNLDGWVTEFVRNLEKELKSTLKEPVSVYFDSNPQDGLLETHNVEKSLESKLKCLIFIPIISRTYCDAESYAWKHEFCAFTKLAGEEELGLEIRLPMGNIASRILPVKIHDLYQEDTEMIQSELNGVLRALDFIYKEPGVNRPLRPTDSRNDNQGRTDYKNQLNKCANAVSEIIRGIKSNRIQPAGSSAEGPENLQQSNIPLRQRLSGRNVYRVSLVYILAALCIWEILVICSGFLGLSGHTIKIIALVLIMLFPLAVFLAWRYERSPAGFIRTSSVASLENAFNKYQRKPFTGNTFITVLIVLVPMLFLAFPDMRITELMYGSKTKEKSIAVLPFINDSPDKDNGYLCNDIMVEIINNLQTIKDLKVKPRTSVESYRNQRKDVKVIGNELGVSLILDGSVSRSGDSLRISTYLIDTKTGNNVWAREYNNKYSESLFEFESFLAKNIAGSLNAVITPQEKKRIDLPPTTQMQAYDLCARGEEMVREWRYTQDSLKLKIALNLLDQALKIDPKYLSAIDTKGMIYAEIGKSDSALIMYDKLHELDPAGMESDVGKGLVYLYSNKPDSAYKYYMKSFQVSPNDIWINLALGQLSFYSFHDVKKGISYYQKSYELGGKSDPEIIQQISILYFYIGDFEKALKYLDKAIYLRPECDLFIRHSYILWAQKEYGEALHYLDSTCAISACEERCNAMRFHIYTELKDYRKAEEFYNYALNSGYKPTDDDNLFIARFLIETGKKKEAYSVLKNLIVKGEDSIERYRGNLKNSMPELYIAAALSMLSEKDKALEYLKHYNPRQEMLVTHLDPGSFSGFDGMKSDPEFKAILQQIADEKSSFLASVREMEKLGEVKL